MTAPTPASAAPPVRHTDQPRIAPARPHQGGVVSVKDRCAAALGERSPERINHRNGYRERRWETRAGALDPRIPKLRQGSYFPAFLEPRKTRRHGGREGLGEAYLQGVSTRSVGELVKAMGMTGISKSQVPRLCAEIDERVLGATRQGCRVALRAQRPRARSERAAPDGRRCDPHRLRTGRCRLCQPPMVDGAEADVLEWAIAVSSVSKSCLKVDRFRACPYRANRPKSQVRRGARPWTQIFRSRVSGGRVGREVDVDRSRGRRRTVVQVWASGLLSAAATVVLGQAPGLLSEVADVAAPVGANLGTDEPETDSSRASLRESGVSEDRNFVRGRLPWAMARSRLVHVDFAHLSAVRDTVALRGSSALRLNLFEDAGYEAVFERAAATGTGYTMSGRLRGVRGSTVTVAVNGDAMAGAIWTAEAVYSIRTAGGAHVVEQLDSQAPLRCNVEPGVIDMSAPPASLPHLSPKPEDPQPRHSFHAGSADTGDIVDVLVVYPTTVRKREGGYRAMRALIDMDIAVTNEAYRVGGAVQRVALAAAVEVDYAPPFGRYASEDMFGALVHLGAMSDGVIDEVHALRDTYAADLVLMHFGSRTLEGYRARAGFAAGVPSRPSSEDVERYGYSVAASDNGLTFAHELGHGMGLTHNRIESPYVNEPFPYSHGYLFNNPETPPGFDSGHDHGGRNGTPILKSQSEVSRRRRCCAWRAGRRAVEQSRRSRGCGTQSQRHAACRGQRASSRNAMSISALGRDQALSRKGRSVPGSRGNPARLRLGSVEREPVRLRAIPRAYRGRRGSALPCGDKRWMGAGGRRYRRGRSPLGQPTRYPFVQARLRALRRDAHRDIHGSEQALRGGCRSRCGVFDAVAGQLVWTLPVRRIGRIVRLGPS